MSEFELRDQTVVVTGAARGIGREIATTLAATGAVVALGDLDVDGAQSVAEELRASSGAEHHGFHLDVRDSSSVRAFADAVVARYGGVEVLVNNAGIARNTPAEEVTDAEWREVLDINLTGTFYCAREFGKHMLEAGRGSVVNIASMSGIIVNKPQPQAAYNASKAAVILLTKSLAAEWADRGVRVNSVSPGYIGTEMTKLGMSNETWRTTWLEMTPFGRVGEPHDVALAVQYLASDAAKFVTGTNLVVDGGYTVW